MRHVRNLFRFQPGKPALAAGLRAATAVTVPFLIALLLEVPDAGWTGLTGLLVTLADRGGSYGSRARAMGATAVLGALVGALAVPAGGGLWLDAALLLAGVCAASLARCYGETAGSIGEKLAVIFVASLGAHAVGIDAAVSRGGALLFGGAWAMLQGLVLWPLHPYRPVRRAVSDLYSGLADATRDVATLTREGAGLYAWTDWSNRHFTLRVKIDAARATLAETRIGRSQESVRGEHLLVLIEISELMVANLLALGQGMEIAPDEKVAKACNDFEVLFRRVSLLARDPDKRVPKALLLPERELLHGLPASVSEWVLRTREHALAAERTARAMHRRRPVSWDGRQNLAPRAHGVRRSLLAPLRDNVGADSLVLRHSLRAAIVSTLALVIARGLKLEGQESWIVLAALGILQPYSASTEERALQRVLGTLLGASLAAVIATNVDSALLLLLVIGILTATSVSLLPLNFGVFQVLLTPDFLLLATLSVGNWAVAETRMLGVLIACALSLSGAWLLWPSPERRRFPEAAAAVLRADGNYLRQVVERRSAMEPEVLGARRELGLALIEAEASFQRLMAEYRGPAQGLEPAMALLTYSRRLAACVTALGAKHPVAHSAEVLEEVAHQAGGALEKLADSLRDGQHPPPIPALPARRATDDPVSGELLERVPRQVAILHGAVAKLSTEVALR
ncbi:MAG: FUSC family protein [Myxococcaceae bacterium]